MAITYPLQVKTAEETKAPIRPAAKDLMRRYMKNPPRKRWRAMVYP